jgi:DNA-binding beta-propeller fold protein YncE
VRAQPAITPAASVPARPNTAAVQPGAGARANAAAPARVNVLSVLTGLTGGLGNVDGPRSTGQLYMPRAMAVDAAGNLVLVNSYSNVVRKVNPQGEVTTLLGIPGRAGILPGPLPAPLGDPQGIAVDPVRGTLYIAVPSAILKVEFP